MQQLNHQVSVQMVPPRIGPTPLVAAARLPPGPEANIVGLPGAWLALHRVHKCRQHSRANTQRGCYHGVQQPCSCTVHGELASLHPQARWGQQCARWLQVCTLAAGAPSCSKEPSPKGMAPGGSATTSLHQCASVIRHKVQTTNLKCPWGDASPRKRPRFCAQHSYPNTHSLGCTCWLEPSPLLATIACPTAWSVSFCSRWCWASSSRHGAGCISGEEAA